MPLKKIVGFILVCALLLWGFLFLSKLTILAVTAVVFPLVGLSAPLDVAWWVSPVIVSAALYFLPRKWLSWNKEYECHGTIIIDAPREVVWNRVKVCARDEYFTTLVTHITPVQNTSDEFIMHFEETMDDGIMPNFVHAKIIDEVEEEYVAYEILNAKDMPGFGADHLLTELVLSDAEGGTKISYIETLSRITLGSFLAFLFLNPARDALVSLKAKMEGSQNTAVLHNWNKSL